MVGSGYRETANQHKEALNAGLPATHAEEVGRGCYSRTVQEHTAASKDHRAEPAGWEGDKPCHISFVVAERLVVAHRHLSDRHWSEKAAASPGDEEACPPRFLLEFGAIQVTKRFGFTDGAMRTRETRHSLGKVSKFCNRKGMVLAKSRGFPLLPGSPCP